MPPLPAEIHKLERRYLTVLVLLSTLVAAQSIAQEPKRYYRLHSRWTRTASQMVPFDYDSDGEHEILRISRGEITQIDILDLNLSAYSASFSIQGMRNHQVIPMTALPPSPARLFIVWKEAQQSQFAVLPPTAALLGRQISRKHLISPPFLEQLPFLKKRTVEQAISPAVLMQPPGSPPIQVFRLRSSFDTTNVRGLIGADARTLEAKWWFLCGPDILSLELGDLDGDGSNELVCGTYALNNGLRKNGTGDDSCYVFALRSDGRLLWRRALGGYWTGIYAGVGDFFGDGQKNVIVFRWSNRRHNSSPDFVQILDGRSGRPLTERHVLGSQGNQLYRGWNRGSLCADINGDGKDELVLGTKGGVVYLLDGELRAIHQSRGYYRPIEVLSVADLAGNSLPEIVCLIPDEKFVVLNSNLQQLTEWPLPVGTNGDLSILKTLRRSFVLLRISYPQRMATYQLLELESSLVPFETQSQAAHVLELLGAFLILLFSILRIRDRLFRQKFQKLLLELLAQVGLISRTLLLDRKGRLRFVGGRWHEILPNGENVTGKSWRDLLKDVHLQPLREAFERIASERSPVQEFVYTQPGGKSLPLRLDAKFLPWFGMCCILLSDRSEPLYLQQVQGWAEVAQRLAHHIKNPLTSVKLNAEELRHVLREKYGIDDEQTQGHFEALLQQVQKLKKMSDSFMRMAEFGPPDLQSVDLNQEIQKLLARWRHLLRPTIRIQYELEEKLPPALVDPAQFEFALQNVLVNAIESIDGEGTILLSTRVTELLAEADRPMEMRRFVEVEIRDTGIGIPAEYLEQVTHPFFTRNKPNGTGMGLTIVKKIMEAHAGQLDIFSESGQGTSVILRFPAAE